MSFERVALKCVYKDMSDLHTWDANKCRFEIENDFAKSIQTFCTSLHRDVSLFHQKWGGGGVVKITGTEKSLLAIFSN